MLPSLIAVVASCCHCHWSFNGRYWLQKCRLKCEWQVCCKRRELVKKLPVDFIAVDCWCCHRWSLLLTIAAIVTAAVTGRCWLQRCRLTFAAVVADCYLCCWRCLCVMRCVRVVGRLAILCWWLFVVDSIWLRARRRYVPTTYYNISICRNRTMTHS